MKMRLKDLNRIWMRRAFGRAEYLRGNPRAGEPPDKEAGDRDADKGYIPILQPGLLEPCAVKVARTVLRGGGRGDTSSLPDLTQCVGLLPISHALGVIRGCEAEIKAYG